MNIYSVNIIGLSLKTHSFDFQLADGFFKRYGTELLSGGDFSAQVTLDKHETFIAADFLIEGNAQLVCDRSLEPFLHPVKIKKRVMFKYGEEPGELNDEVIIITREQAALELGQLMYEFIGIELPMKKLHPRFQETDEEDSEGKIVYTSEDSEVKSGEQPIDPRWEILKKLK